VLCLNWPSDRRSFTVKRVYLKGFIFYLHRDTAQYREAPNEDVGPNNTPIRRQSSWSVDESGTGRVRFVREGGDVVGPWVTMTPLWFRRETG